SSGGLGTKTSVAVMAAPGTTHQDAGLADGTTYYYQLTARDVTGNESGGSTEVNGTPSDTTAPSAPAGLGVANPATGGLLNLSWAAVTDETLKDYGIYRATYTGFVVGAAFQAARIAPPGTTHQEAGLANGTTYYYKLTSRDATGNESAGSSEVSGTPTDTTAPAAPTGLGMAAAAAGQRLNVSWAANSEADLSAYRLYRATSAGPVGSKGLAAAVAAPGTTAQDAGLANGTTYYYQLTARDVTGNASGATGEVTGTPQDTVAPAPAGGGGGGG
ncbi:MAG: hypothetical protein AAB368_16925, partial [bacterium]